MAKYSTGGGGGGGDGDSCELCGKTGVDLRTATVAGAELDVCPECAPHDDSQQQQRSRSGSGSTPRDEQTRKRQAARNLASASDAVGGDSTHWEEEGTDYERDRLPYLVDGYGTRVERARQEAGLRRDELAAELDVDENDLLAVEQGRATRAGVGGSVIRAIEAYLDVTLVED